MHITLRIAFAAACLLAACPARAAEDNDCIQAHTAFITSFHEFLAADAAFAELLAEIESPRARGTTALERIDAVKRYVAENHDAMMTDCGTIMPERYAEAWRLYRINMLGVEVDQTGNIRRNRVSFGRKLIDSDDFGSNAFMHKVPFLVSYHDDKVSDESGLSVLGDVAYQFGALALQHAFTGSFDVDTTEPVEESTVEIGYGMTWVRAYGAHGERFIDETETTFGVTWFTDRDFKRKAYGADLTLTPSIDSIGAGNYIRQAGPFDYAWAPSIALSAGHVIEANGNEAFIAMQDAGTYVQATPALSLSFAPRSLPKLQFVAEYAHTFDLKHGRDAGMLAGSLNYQIIGPMSLTVVYREGHEAPFFKKTHDYLFGVGIKY